MWKTDPAWRSNSLRWLILIGDVLSWRQRESVVFPPSKAGRRRESRRDETDSRREGDQAASKITTNAIYLIRSFHGVSASVRAKLDCSSSRRRQSSSALLGTRTHAAAAATAFLSMCYPRWTVSICQYPSSLGSTREAPAYSSIKSSKATPNHPGISGQISAREDASSVTWCDVMIQSDQWDQ